MSPFPIGPQAPILGGRGTLLANDGPVKPGEGAMDFDGIGGGPSVPNDGPAVVAAAGK